MRLLILSVFILSSSLGLAMPPKMLPGIEEVVSEDDLNEDDLNAELGDWELVPRERPPVVAQEPRMIEGYFPSRSPSPRGGPVRPPTPQPSIPELLEVTIGHAFEQLEQNNHAEAIALFREAQTWAQERAAEIDEILVQILDRLLAAARAAIGVPDNDIEIVRLYRVAQEFARGIGQTERANEVERTLHAHLDTLIRTGDNLTRQNNIARANQAYRAAIQYADLIGEGDIARGLRATIENNAPFQTISLLDRTLGTWPFQF